MNCTELQELAAGLALGALDAADAARLQAALAQSLDAKAELATFQDVAAALVQATCPPIAPRPELRAKLLQQIQPCAPKSAAAPVLPIPPGFHFVLSDSSDWRPGAFPGYRYKLLATSRDMGYQVIFAEISAGMPFPAHDHHSSEELYVLTGHLRTEGRLLGPGDFLHSEPGTHHHELLSPDGCTALMILRARVPA